MSYCEPRAGGLLEGLEEIRAVRGLGGWVGGWVGGRTYREAVGAQGRARVEPKPPKPQEGGTQHDEGDVGGVVFVLL